MKLTLTHYGTTSTVATNRDDHTVDEVLSVFRGLMVIAGFSPTVAIPVPKADAPYDDPTERAISTSPVFRPPESTYTVDPEQSSTIGPSYDTLLKAQDTDNWIDYCAKLPTATPYSWPKDDAPVKKPIPAPYDPTTSCWPVYDWLKGDFDPMVAQSLTPRKHGKKRKAK